ncbi:hypothetical protein H6G76_34510 [Nostoc sp. FACHB-152]|nr:hypothetical protein [Nostoc sp. FACHB-152]MBD2452132.1 hypothetical protein [Nostoc sp. FACHB-152]
MLSLNRQALADDGKEFVFPPAVVVERDKTECDRLPIALTRPQQFR